MTNSKSIWSANKSGEYPCPQSQGHRIIELAGGQIQVISVVPAIFMMLSS